MIEWIAGIGLCMGLVASLGTCVIFFIQEFRRYQRDVKEYESTIPVMEWV
jgi:hypothetical protein